MKKFLLITLLALIFTLCVFASDAPLLIDEADLLTDLEEQTVLSELEDIRATHNMDVVLLLVNSIGDSTPEQFADDYYDYNGYSADGILLLVSMEYRDWHMSTAGYGITAFTDAGLEYIADDFLYYLSDGDYYNASMVFADDCDFFIEQARSGEPFDVDNIPKEPFDVFFTALFALVVAFVIALIVTSVMKAELKSVRAESRANSYIKSGGLKLTNSNEIFLYRNVTRTVRETNNSSGGSRTHTSSSGTTHGGRGGKF